MFVVGVILFAVFGLDWADVPPQQDAAPLVSNTRDEAVIDRIARAVAEESIDVDKDQASAGFDASDADGSVRAGTFNRAPRSDGSKDSKVATDATKNVQSQRLNLSGQTVDDALKRSADGKFDITFDHIKFDIPKGEPYSPNMLTQQVRSLDGQEVKLRGYIRPSFKQRDLKNFIFVRDDKECCFGPGAALFDCVVVKLAKDQKTDYTVRPVAVTGKFVLKEYTGPDGNVWAIYRMKDAAVAQ